MEIPYIFSRDRGTPAGPEAGEQSFVWDCISSIASAIFSFFAWIFSPITDFFTSRETTTPPPEEIPEASTATTVFTQHTSPSPSPATSDRGDKEEFSSYADGDLSNLSNGSDIQDKCKPVDSGSDSGGGSASDDQPCGVDGPLPQVEMLSESISSPAIEPIPVARIWNSGNDCWLISLLQFASVCAPFRQALIEVLDKKGEGTPAQDFFAQYEQNLAADSAAPDRFTCEALRRAIGCALERPQEFIGTDQTFDPEEILGDLLDLLPEGPLRSSFLSPCGTTWNPFVTELAFEQTSMLASMRGSAVTAMTMYRAMGMLSTQKNIPDQMFFKVNREGPEHTQDLTVYPKIAVKRDGQSIFYECTTVINLVAGVNAAHYNVCLLKEGKWIFSDDKFDPELTDRPQLREMTKDEIDERLKQGYLYCYQKCEDGEGAVELQSV